MLSFLLEIDVNEKPRRCSVDNCLFIIKTYTANTFRSRPLN